MIKDGRLPHLACRCRSYWPQGNVYICRPVCVSRRVLLETGAWAPSYEAVGPLGVLADDREAALAHAAVAWSAHLHARLQRPPALTVAVAYGTTTTNAGCGCGCPTTSHATSRPDGSRTSRCRTHKNLRVRLSVFRPPPLPWCGEGASTHRLYTTSSATTGSGPPRPAAILIIGQTWPGARRGDSRPFGCCWSRCRPARTGRCAGARRHAHTHTDTMS
jgi:hypothetical protein